MKCARDGGSSRALYLIRLGNGCSRNNKVLHPSTNMTEKMRPMPKPQLLELIATTFPSQFHLTHRKSYDGAFILSTFFSPISFSFCLVCGPMACFANTTRHVGYLSEKLGVIIDFSFCLLVYFVRLGSWLHQCYLLLPFDSMTLLLYCKSAMKQTQLDEIRVKAFSTISRASLFYSRSPLFFFALFGRAKPAHGCADHISTILHWHRNSHFDGER